MRDRVNIGTVTAFIIIPAFIVLAVWWLESRFDSLVAVIVIGGLFGAIFLITGFVLASWNTKMTMANMAQFAERDAQTDRYRQQTFRTLAQGDNYLLKAIGQVGTIDAKRVDQIAQQRAKLLTGGEQPAASNDAWTWDDDQPAKGGASYQVWE